MENKKTLKINTAVCDVRGVTEEILSAYEAVRINSGVIITNRSAQALLGRSNAKLNCASVQTLEDNVRFSTYNGRATISPSTAVSEEKTFLTLNGRLDIEPGSEEALKGYAAIVVNGSVTCPRSIVDLLGGALTVNGRLNAYPDGCIRLKDTTVLDRFFHLRAKQDAVYYAARCVAALSPDIGFAGLAEKNVRFETKKLLVSESLAETAVPFFDEAVDITVLPDGCAYVNDDAVLDEALLKRYGGKLYVTGDLTIPSGAAALLDQASFLRVDGDLLVSRALKDKVLSMDVEYGDLCLTGGTLITDAGSQKIDACMLERARDGLSALNCASISIGADVAPALLEEKLVSIIGCASVACATREQLSIAALRCKDVASITLEGHEDEEDGEEEDADLVTVNTAFYAF